MLRGLFKMVVELKYGKSADEAIAQIKEKKYTDALWEYQENILLIYARCINNA